MWADAQQRDQQQESACDHKTADQLWVGQLISERGDEEQREYVAGEHKRLALVQREPDRRGPCQAVENHDPS